jgi:hypothetical protein
LSFQIASESTEFLVAQVVRLPSVLRFGRTHRSGADTCQVSTLGIQWDDYGSSDAIALGFTGGNDLRVEDRDLGLAPRRSVEVVAPVEATTGQAITLATVPRHGVAFEIICVAKSDTVNTHGRWAVKPPLRDGLLPDYDFLASGVVSGERPIPPAP